MTHLALAPMPTNAVLANALRGRRLTAFERRLIAVLHHDIFRRSENLRSSEACALAYRRLRYLRERMDLDLFDLMKNLDRLLALHEWVGLVDGTMMTILSIHFNLCIGTMLAHGELPELRPLLDELNAMESFGVFLATELAYGNNVQALETEAVYDHVTREFVIHTPRAEAQKFMPNTGADGIPKLGVVLARLKVGKKNCGVFPFVVRIRSASSLCLGVHVSPLGDKPDYALDNAITSFDQVRIPFHHWLSGEESCIDDVGIFSSAIASAGRRFLTSMERVQAGKLCISAGALTVLRGTLDLTLRYAQQRKTFGPGRRDVPIIHYRTYQRVLFEGIAAAYACAFLLRTASDEHAQGAERAHSLSAQRLLASTKVFISSRAIETIAQCRERIGAQGLFSENRIISYLIQTHGVVTAEGDNEILLVRMARELITGSDYEPPAVRSTPALLESPDYLLSLLCQRERNMVLELRTRLGERGASMFEVWNDLISEAVELATLHVRRTALEAFNQGLDAIDDDAARDVLNRLFRLLALKEIMPHTASLLMEGALSPAVARNISAERTRLAASLLSDAPLLSESFDIPDSLLEVPIARDYIASYDRMSPVRAPLESGFAPRNSREGSVAANDSLSEAPIKSSG